MSGHAAPLSPEFEADLARMESEDLGPVGVPGALFGEDAPVARPPSAGSDAGLPHLLPPGTTPQAALAETLRLVEEDTVRAWAHVAHEYAARAARSAAQELESGTWRGPLHGVPVGVKDVIDVAGMPTVGGSAYLREDRHRRLPELDAGSVAVMLRAGAVVVGKTHTHEFAMGGTTPPTRNPHDLDRIPGGSSGGSAAAVAAGHVRVALGSDSGGSVRIPSAYCGTAGLVPTPGLLPGDGVLPLAWSLDRVGVIAAGVEDLVGASLALGLVGHVDRERGFAGLRIGIPRGTFEGAVDDVVVDAVQEALARAEQAGAVLHEVDVPHQWAAVTAGMAIMLGEGAEEHPVRRLRRPDLLGEDVNAMLAMADRLGASTYVRAQRMRHVLRQELLAALDGVDVLATPTMPCLAPLVEEAATGRLTVGGTTVGLADAHLRYNVGANLAALPCGTQPVPRPEGALPIGLEWVAVPRADPRVLEAMVAMEASWD